MPEEEGLGSFGGRLGPRRAMNMDLPVPGYYDRYFSALPGGPEMRHIGNWNQNWMMNVPGSEYDGGRIIYAKHHGSASLSPKRILSSDNAGSLLGNATRSFVASDRSVSSRISFSFGMPVLAGRGFGFGCTVWMVDVSISGNYWRVPPEIPGPALEWKNGGGQPWWINITPDIIGECQKIWGVMEEKQRRVVIDTMSGEYH